MSTRILASGKPHKVLSKLPLVLWLLLWPLSIVMFLSSIKFGGLRLAIALSIFALWAGVLAMWWRNRVLRGAGIAAAIVVCAMWIMPPRHTNAAALRREYVQALNSYENVPYVWGGENKHGIDCSGLVRCALIDANWRHGWRNVDAALLRQAVAMWWNDASAKNLGEGYKGKTYRLFEAPDLNALDYTRLLPGDFAVTTPDGVHTMAYIGNRTWIEADPSALLGDKVVKVTVPTQNAWFARRVRLMRWRQFDARPATPTESSSSL